MIGPSLGDYPFIVEYTYLAFLVGVLLGYLYFRQRQISVGGTLAVGYLAASLYQPVNAVVTVLISLVGYALIRYVILKAFLPRPRQVFGIGLAVGIACGAAWLAVAHWVLGMEQTGDAVTLVGVIVPGMLCNSLTKQGVARTLIPLAVMVPLAGLAGFLLALLSTTVAPMDLQYPADGPGVEVLFAVSAVSVLLAVVVQETTSGSWTLRTGGYVTAGLLLVAAFTDPWYLAVIAVATAITLAVYVPFSRAVPLFGKDRFIILCLLSLFLVTGQELLLYAFTDIRLGGPAGLVFAILPAIMANDLLQYGLRRTGGGMGLALAGCAVVAVPLLGFT
ncbi:poly-gamma-glutamate biosynthesis protein PgsC/CapC [Gordonia sp. VNK21]|uniref:poly-gamma-glutamate biosynthesis protein PgsC/CapC n=1 Tax=Gordonia sp. VNK21 TaxID=3382483 RepID=UPI0038D35586